MRSRSLTSLLLLLTIRMIFGNRGNDKFVVRSYQTVLSCKDLVNCCHFCQDLGISRQDLVNFCLILSFLVKIWSLLDKILRAHRTIGFTANIFHRKLGKTRISCKILHSYCKSSQDTAFLNKISRFLPRFLRRLARFELRGRS